MLSEVNFSEVKNKCIFIDVRSPGEFAEGSIYGAINIPILSDEERKIVGTAYKQTSKNEARRLGIEFVSPKLIGIFDKILEIKKENPYLVVYCARGGYRSTAFASIFSAIGVNLFKLIDGYKGYRKYISEALPRINDGITYIVVHGNTGVGKTDILMELRGLGYDVLDLEGAANHRGSLLGSIGIGECNSQKAFEASLFNQLDSIKSKYVFVEAESKQIGKTVVPDYIFSKMKSGIHIFVDADLDYRAKSLKKDYVLNENWIEESIQAINLLRKYISNERVDYLQGILKQGEFEEVAKELMMNYYDPMYMHKANEYEYAGKFTSKISANETAKEISEWFEKSGLEVR